MKPSRGERSRPVKLRDVAEAAGVAVGTVSRVLNDNPTVSEPIRAKVQRAIDALGYERDVVAQSMRGGSTHLVACAIRDFDIPRFAIYIKEAERVFRENGYTLLLSSTTNRPEVEMTLLRTFERRRVDGIMMTVSDETHQGVSRALKSIHVPVLLIDREQGPASDRVVVDHRSGARAAADYLLGLGHRRIALLVGDIKAFPSRSRLQGFQDAFKAAGHVFDTRLLRDHVLDQNDAFRDTMALLAQADPPTALFVTAMDALGGSLRALKALGRQPGKDIAVLTGSDSDLAELFSPSITAVRWDLAEMGRQAATMLIERMRGAVKSEPRTVRLPTLLIIRESCNRVSISDAPSGPAAAPARRTRVTRSAIQP
jgi:LacI family transcriptional regulator